MIISKGVLGLKLHLYLGCQGFTLLLHFDHFVGFSVIFSKYVVEGGFNVSGDHPNYIHDFL